MTRPSLAIQYSRAAFTETSSLTVELDPNPRSPRGLMGREVASQQFLAALLKFGSGSRIDALLGSESDRDCLKQQCTAILKDTRDRRHIRTIPPGEVGDWFANPTSELLHFPFPPDHQVAVKRQRVAPHAFAISGVTHTLCSLPAIESLWRCLVSPFETYDRWICTSRAVENMVLDTVDAMTEEIARRSGQKVKWRPGLEVCPLGVDLDLHRPATSQERFEARRRLGITNDKLVLLFTGRLSHHAKAQPYPMFVGAQNVAEQTGEDVCLVLCGWFASQAVRRAFETTARRIAPKVRLIVVDGMDAWWRMHAWDAADIFVSLADSIQETFGLTPLEAMARGIPVVASDWNGYRDIVEHGCTGWLVPTSMVRGSNQGLTEKLVNGAIDYDHFLASVGQTVNVTIDDVCQSMVSLALNIELRKRFGRNGRDRAERHFGWPKVIAQYEAIWDAQRSELGEARKQGISVAVPISLGEVFYPKIERSFFGYPTTWVEVDERCYAKGWQQARELTALLSDPLCMHTLAWSAHSSALIRSLQESREILTGSEWLIRSQQAGVDEAEARDLFAWLCKYGMLVATDLQSGQKANARSGPLITFVTTCKGRLDDLKKTLPILQAQPNCEVIVVDYSCPQKSGDWVRANYPSVKVVSVPGKDVFDRSEAKNAGGFAVKTQWICLLDADIVLSRDFIDTVTPSLKPGAIVRSDKVREGTGGTFLCEKSAFDLVGGHDPVFRGWGEQDEDLVDALRFAGGELVHYPAELVTHIHHDDAKRTEFHDEKNRALSHTINRIYRSMKWDWSRIAGSVPSVDERQRLRFEIDQQVKRAVAHTDNCVIEIDLGKLVWNPLGIACDRRLQYRLGGSPVASGTSKHEGS